MFDLTQALKYLMEGLAVALAAYYIPRRNMNLQEVALIALSAAATFAVLDMFAPSVATGSRRGAGFAVGQQIVTGQSGGNPTPMPFEFYNPGQLAYDNDVVAPVVAPVVATQEGGAYEEEASSHPYKLVDGIYADKILLAGYNENVQAYNNDKLECELESYP